MRDTLEYSCDHESDSEQTSQDIILYDYDNDPHTKHPSSLFPVNSRDSKSTGIDNTKLGRVIPATRKEKRTKENEGEIRQSLRNEVDRRNPRRVSVTKHGSSLQDSAFSLDGEEGSGFLALLDSMKNTASLEENKTEPTEKEDPDPLIFFDDSMKETQERTKKSSHLEIPNQRNSDSRKRKETPKSMQKGELKRSQRTSASPVSLRSMEYTTGTSRQIFMNEKVIDRPAHWAAKPASSKIPKFGSEMKKRRQSNISSASLPGRKLSSPLSKKGIADVLMGYTRNLNLNSRKDSSREDFIEDEGIQNEHFLDGDDPVHHLYNTQTPVKQAHTKRQNKDNNPISKISGKLGELLRISEKRDSRDKALLETAKHSSLSRHSSDQPGRRDSVVLLLHCERIGIPAFVIFDAFIKETHLQKKDMITTGTLVNVAFNKNNIGDAQLFPGLTVQVFMPFQVIRINRPIPLLIGCTLLKISSQGDDRNIQQLSNIPPLQGFHRN